MHPRRTSYFTVKSLTCLLCVSAIGTIHAWGCARALDTYPPSLSAGWSGLNSGALLHTFLPLLCGTEHFQRVSNFFTADKSDYTQPIICFTLFITTKRHPPPHPSTHTLQSAHPWILPRASGARGGLHWLWFLGKPLSPSPSFPIKSAMLRLQCGLGTPLRGALQNHPGLRCVSPRNLPLQSPSCTSWPLVR